MANAASVPGDDNLTITPAALSFNKTKKATLRVTVRDANGILAPGVKVAFAVVGENPFSDVSDLNFDITDKDGAVTATFILKEAVYFGTEMKQAKITVTADIPAASPGTGKTTAEAEVIVSIIPVGPGNI